jgi:predicted nucleic acid-binding protein
MILLDTSILIPCLRRKGAGKMTKLITYIGSADFYIPVFVELELLQGCDDEGEWNRLSHFIAEQDVLVPTRQSWFEAARIKFDMARGGATVRSAIDCCIAQMALERSLTLLHFDRDYETISKFRPLSQHYLDLGTLT